MQFQSLTLIRRMLSLACTCAALSAAAAPTYTITQLAGSGNCGPVSINDAGDVAGACNGTAVVWHQGLAKPLGRLAGGTYSQANYVNSFGVAVGDGDTGDSRPLAWVSTANGLYNFFSNNGGNTHTLFIGDNGYIGGYYTKSLSGNTSSWKGAIWTQDPRDPRKYREVDLPVLGGGIDPRQSSSIPWAFNQLGQAAGYAVTDQIGQHAAFWNNNAAHTIVDLGVFPGDWTSLAYGLNDAGQVVGESHPAGGNRAVLWNNDAAHTVSELPLLPGDNYGSARNINMRGQVLGLSAYETPGTTDVTPSRPVVWRDGGVFDLQAVLDPVTGAGWTVTSALGLNDSGQIVGTGTLDGVVSIFVMTPVPQ
jgi:uncharacterized membrane protein